MTRMQRNIIIILALIWGSLAAFLLLSDGVARAGDSDTASGKASPFVVDELSLTYRDFFPGGRDPLITNNGLQNRGLGQELVLQMNTDVLRYGYFNNMIHTKTDTRLVPGDNAGQFRSVGWEFEAGIRATSWLSGGYHHHSQHTLDTQFGPGFPVEDALEIKLYFIKQNAKAGLLPW